MTRGASGASAPSASVVAVAVVVGALVGALTTLGGDAWSIAAALAIGGAVAATVLEPRVGLLAAIALVPLDSYGRVLGSPVLVTAYQVLLIATLLSWGARILVGRARLRLRAAEIAATALVVAGLWSLATSADRAATVVSCIRLGFEIVLFVLCTRLLTDRRWLRAAAAVLVVSALAAAVLAFVQTASPDIGLGFAQIQGTVQRAQILRVTALFSDPNMLGGFMSVAAAAFLAAAVHARKAVPAVLWIAATAIAAGAMYLTYSRGSWMAFAACVPVIVATAPAARRAIGWFAIVAVVAVVLVTSPGVLVDRLTSSFDVQNDASAATRYQMYVSTVRMIADRPIFGTGLGAYNKVYPAYRDSAAAESVSKPHQVPLAFVAETGVAGLAVEVLLVVLLVRALARRRGRPWSAWEAAGAAGTTAILLGSLFEYYLYFEYLWIFAALWVVATRIASNEEVVDV
ncbi:MAG: O-antigen ligase family protein [Coriobacteriia bacterium]|nr:O-antigen ligase family protein [Coriobacteriia bacterium]